MVKQNQGLEIIDAIYIFRLLFMHKIKCKSKGNVWMKMLYMRKTEAFHLKSPLPLRLKQNQNNKERKSQKKLSLR